MAKEDIDFLQSQKIIPKQEDWMEKSLNEIQRSFKELSESCKDFINIGTQK